MKIVKLSEVCEVLDSKRIPVTANNRKKGIYPYYGANGIQDYVSDYIFDDELVLLAEDGGNFGSKDKPIAYRVSGKCWVNNHAHVLKPRDNINVDYLCDALKFYDVTNIINGATRKKLTQAAMLGMQIPLPDLDKQNKISLELKTCTTIIEKHRKLISKYDTLIKSRFIEMFGDPTTNPMNWDTVNISSLLTANASNGFFAKRDEYTEDGNVKVLGVVNIVNTMYSKIDLLPKTNASEKDIKKYSVKYGDMLFCRSSLVAEGIGKASIVPENINKTILFECHVIRLRLDLNKCVPEYMQMLSTTSFFRNQVLKHAKTSTMTTIGQDGILKTDVRLPPIEKQKQFLSFIKQIDKSKFAVQKSLEKAETLYKSLMQEYFG